jgi:hypothetical protein
MRILCADWSAHQRGRAAAVADTVTRRVSLLSGPVTLARLLDVAASYGGPVVVGIDAPIGAPRSLLRALQIESFRNLLRWASSSPAFFSPVTGAADWRPQRPFFAVPAGAGSLTAFRDAAAACGVDLLRDIDRQTGAKSFAITSGIPGSVGSSAVALWRELITSLDDDRVRLWPCDGEGDLTDIASAGRGVRVVVAEIYPRAAYATALLDVPAAARPQVALAKTKPPVRLAAVDALLKAGWRGAAGVVVDDDALDAARASEDAFDAVFAACALLRAHLDGDPPSAPLLHPRTEGAIWGTGSVDLGRRTTWSPDSVHR